MKQIKTNVYEVEGYAVTVDLEGDLEEYAKNFLHIFNNVRESEDLVKVKNYYGSNLVTVYCNLESKNALVKYLGVFGEVKSCDKVIMYQIDEPDFDMDKYEDNIIIPDFE